MPEFFRFTIALTLLLEVFWLFSDESDECCLFLLKDKWLESDWGALILISSSALSKSPGSSLSLTLTEEPFSRLTGFLVFTL